VEVNVGDPANIVFAEHGGFEHLSQYSA
jgi:hypothetical protein